ncbi:MAG: TatD family hydrolase [Bacillus sp. (in: Bacteria)]|nr:TatD family hydrolase [Bacillus sp. (in: firmicutes)]MCM1426848.1 TatD family hydrolase [Eubacterium sp.]
MIFESHAHYDDEAFDNDRDTLLSSLPENGIDMVINVGASLDSCKTTLALMEKYDFVYGAMGVHPSETGELNEKNFQWLKEQCMRDKIVAVGEIGLDYHWKEPEEAVQKKWFERQLALAEEVKLPVIIHSREAAKDTLDIMKGMQAENIGGVIHCFSYTKEIAAEYLRMGYYFGIGGVVTFENAKKLKEAVSYIPLEKILLETDSPYLAPAPNRGKRNSSLNIPYIAKEIATIKGVSYEKVLAMTHENASSLFGLKSRNAAQ